MNSFKKVASTRYSYLMRKLFFEVRRQQLRNTRQVSTTETVQETSNTNAIKIPKRIERGPTDILKALSNTVKRDYNAPHYKYHDDPFLIPTSNISKRMFALSQESGRKAAQWIRQEHADLFQHRVADPPIEVYFPRAVYDEKSEVDETVLQKVIEQHRVSDALTIYGLLEENSVELSRATKQSLLELLCYYNSQDPLEEEWIEERWFRQGNRSREKKKNVWKRGGVVENLFKNMSPPDAASYTALLCGRAQFGDVQGAYQIYQEALDAGIGLSADAFNALITGASVLKEGHELRWAFIEELLASMKQQGVSPNLGTLNAILETLSSMSSNKESQKRSLAVVAEFRAMGIEPSLASYYFLLNTFCQDKSSMRSAILVSILNLLEGKSLEIRDPRDVMFFTQAMDVCRFHLSDLDTAHRVDRLLHTADNYNLIGDSYKESIYYRNFFALACQMGTLEEFMELYNKLVPNIYVPEPGIMEEIIKTVDLNEAWELLPRLWSDVVMFEHTDRESLICAVLTALQRSQTDDTELTGRLADVAWGIWERLENQRESRFNKKISWTGQMLGDVMLVLLRADRYLQAVDITTALDKRQHEILGVPSFQSLSMFLGKSIERKEIKKAIWTVQYCSEAGFEDTIKLAQLLNSSVQLDSDQKSQLGSIVGPQALVQAAATA
uniref:Small ribosomal subunit protein mS39 n=1 Tax=Homalodisca liturata TaxID=320908 RepID=A0A1B6HTV0_9HEMI